jgi:glucose-1-phosphatase
MHTPKAVVFDLGKVLLDFDYRKAGRNLLEHCSIPEAEITKVLNQSALLFRYETGLMTTNEFFEEVKRASKFCHGLETFEPLFGNIFTPIPEMIALNDRLRAKGIPTYIFSNTNEMAVKHISATYPFFANFSGHIYSYEHRSMKPDPAIYKVVEKISGHSGPGILYIDDREENIAHGTERGWQTIHHADKFDTITRVQTLLPLAQAD